MERGKGKAKGRDEPMKEGLMHWFSMYSPTSLSSIRALVRGSEQSTLC
jgi:hypothetical protein